MGKFYDEKIHYEKKGALWKKDAKMKKNDYEKGLAMWKMFLLGENYC